MSDTSQNHCAHKELSGGGPINYGNCVWVYCVGRDRLISPTNRNISGLGRAMEDKEMSDAPPQAIL